MLAALPCEAGRGATVAACRDLPGTGHEFGWPSGTEVVLPFRPIAVRHGMRGTPCPAPGWFRVARFFGHHFLERRALA